MSPKASLLVALRSTDQDWPNSSRSRPSRSERLRLGHDSGDLDVDPPAPAGVAPLVQHVYIEPEPPVICHPVERPDHPRPDGTITRELHRRPHVEQHIVTASGNTRSGPGTRGPSGTQRYAHRSPTPINSNASPTKISTACATVHAVSINSLIMTSPARSRACARHQPAGPGPGQDHRPSGYRLGGEPDRAAAAERPPAHLRRPHPPRRERPAPRSARYANATVASDLPGSGAWRTGPLFRRHAPTRSATLDGGRGPDRAGETAETAPGATETRERVVLPS